jgi:tetratricopeptide (TPR) repeat protein
VLGAAALLSGFALRPAQAAEPTALDLARRGLNECEAGRRSTVREERQAHFERGRALSDRAVALDAQSAEAHFAVFCNMGELMRLDGETVSSLFQLRRLNAEIDRTLELNPEYTEAMAAKGILLIRLPRLLGGDAEKGETLLRRVLQKDPNAVESRLMLAKTCDARGDRDEAVAFATRALQIAREQGRADKVAEAQATLAELHAGR